MRRVIILNAIADDAEQKVFRVVYWPPVPQGFQDADPERVSVMEALDIPEADRMTKAERVAYRDGEFAEFVDNLPVAKLAEGGKPLPVDALFVALANAAIDQYNLYAAQVLSRNERVFYGSTYTDERGWEPRIKGQ